MLSVFLVKRMADGQIPLHREGHYSQHRRVACPTNRLINYSVMHSDDNSFCGDIVLDSFNKVSKNEDNILEQIFN